MTKAFVSYSRKDADFTRKLTDALIEQKIELWIDWKNIPPTVDWRLQIQKGVEEAGTFLFLISPDSIKSRECAEELIHAIKNGKRLIPVVVREINADDAPKELKHINWIFFNKPDCFDELFQQLLSAINTDYEWLQFHSQLQGKALEWERQTKDNSLLLRGMELETVEGQLVVNASKEPVPTDIQKEYVLESKMAKEAERKAREKQRRLITVSSIVVAVVMLFLAVWAYGQKIEADTQRDVANKASNEAQRSQKAEASAAKYAQEKQLEAEQQANLARINEIVGLAVAQKDQNYNRALLYSVEAYRRAEDAGINIDNAQTALLTTLQDRHGLVQILPGHNDWISKVAFSADGKTLVSASYDDVVLLWDTSNPTAPVNIKKMKGHDVAVSTNNKVLATAGYDQDYNAQIILWDITDNANPSQLSSSVIGESLVSFTSNDSKLITGKYECDESECNSIIQIWDITNPSTPALLSTVDGDNANLSANGRFLTTSGFGNDGPIVKLWDISNYTAPVLLKTLNGYSGVINPNGTILAVSTYNDAGNSTVDIWDITNPSASAKPLSTIMAFSDWVSSIGISPQNKILIGSDDGSILIWDISDPSNPWTSPSTDKLKAHASYVSNIAFNTTGNIMASGGSDGNIMIWDMDRIKNPIQFDLPDLIPGYSPDGKTILVRLYDEKAGNTINSLWDVTDPSKPISLGSLNFSNIDHAVFSPDKKSLVTRVNDYDTGLYTLILWDISDANKPTQHKLSDQYFDTISFSPDSRILIASYQGYSNEPSVGMLWDISNISSPIQLEVTDYSIGSASFNSDNTLLAYPNSNESTIVFWDIRNSGQFKKIGTIPGGDIHLDARGTFAAISANDAETPKVELWNIPNWKDRAKLSTLDGFSPLLIPDKNLIVTESYNEESTMYELHFWDISTPSKPVETVLNGSTGYVSYITVSPSKKLLATGNNDRTITLWDISDPRKPGKLPALKGHRDGISAINFSPDSSTLASGSWDGGVILWDVKEPSKAHQFTYLKAASGSVDSLEFINDGKTLISSGSNETIYWDLNPHSWIDKACRIANSNFSPEEWTQLFWGDRYRLTCENVGNSSIVTAQPVEPVNSSNPSASSTTLPLCTDTEGASGCPLVTWNAHENERDRFCIDKVSYSLYAMPDGTTLTPIDQGFTCTDEGVRGGFQMYTCYSLEHPNRSFQATMCNTSCQVAQSDQCETGLGLDSTQSCCAPESTDGCTQVTLEVGGCVQ